MSSFCSIEALVGTLDTLDSDENARLVALYDHEEVQLEQTPAVTLTLTSLARSALSLRKVLNLLWCNSYFVDCRQVSTSYLPVISPHPRVAVLP